LDIQDKKFGVKFFKNNHSVPSEEYWNHVSSNKSFLKMFYESRLHISNSSYVTSHMYVKEVFGIGKRFESNDEKIKSIERER